MRNPYLPYLARITDIREEAKGERAVKTFRLEFFDEGAKETFKRRQPGQCAMLGLLGEGESMISISSSPTKGDYIEFSVMLMGRVTSALHRCEPGDVVTVRGPYGNGFPLEEWRGKHVITIGGGIGQAPLRSLIQYVLDRREQYGIMMVIYGARTTADLCFKQELFELEKRPDVEVHLSIDVPEEGWDKFVGFVPQNLMEVRPSPEDAVAITCGPPIMIRFVVQNLLELGFSPEQIYTTLESRMKCGLGKCGRCNVGPLYVCKDGPVFSYATLRELPEG